MCVWSGDQDAPQRPGDQSRAKGHDHSGTIETSSTGVGGFGETEHFVCRAAESDRSTRLGLSGSPNARSGSVEAVSRWSSGITTLPLQLRKAPPGIEVWTGSPDAGDAGWVDQQAADIEDNLLIKNFFAVAEERHFRVFCLGPAGDLHSSRIRSSGLATIDDGSTPSVVSKVRFQMTDLAQETWRVTGRTHLIKQNRLIIFTCQQICELI